MSHLHSLLNDLRRRPGMYIGAPSLTRLAAFLLGYDYARYELRAEAADPFFVSFQEWIEQRLQSPHRAWDEAILSQSGSEAEGFERFWQLLDDYKRSVGWAPPTGSANGGQCPPYKAGAET
jgi:hypothetical protein